ncbi:MAG TPA: AI-2E family transporter [Polyangiaceae bacterium]|nr:AI-2E family transporter [Polyangiaceae bacterium]
MESDTLPLPADLRWRRLIAVALFLGLLFAFRRLAPVFVCFVVLERAIGWAAGALASRAKLSPRASLLTVLGALAALVAVEGYLGVRRVVAGVRALRAEAPGYWDALVANPVVGHLRQLAGAEGEGLVESVKAHAMSALHYATATAHVAVYLIIGLLLALIYLFERDEIDHFFDELAPSSVGGTLARWLGYAADAVAVTARMQAVVAVVNAALTLPVLWLLRLPNVPLLGLVILVSGLLPVVGNLLSGAVLCAVAYQARGAWAVGVFLGVTFVLHKIESYYLNPRLAAEHVKLPGLLLVVSLLLFEQVFGFAGLFLSFPSLYVAMRVRNEWRAADAARRAALGPAGPPAAGDAPRAAA